MNNKSERKSNFKLIIVIIIIILLILFAVWFFFLKDNRKTNKNNSNIQENSNNEKNLEKKQYEYNYRDGVLTQVVDEDGNPKQNDFIIDGIILVGNRHNYNDINNGVSEVIETLSKEGYKKENINSSFYLNEYIRFYIDTKYSGDENDVRIYIIPHKAIEEIEKMNSDDLELYAFENGSVTNYLTPDSDNYKFSAETYVNQDLPEGKYDILFSYKGKVAYFININETKEPNN